MDKFHWVFLDLIPNTLQTEGLTQGGRDKLKVECGPAFWGQ